MLDDTNWLWNCTWSEVTQITWKWEAQFLQNLCDHDATRKWVAKCEQFFEKIFWNHNISEERGSWFGEQTFIPPYRLGKDSWELCVRRVVWDCPVWHSRMCIGCSCVHPDLIWGCDPYKTSTVTLCLERVFELWMEKICMSVCERNVCSLFFVCTMVALSEILQFKVSEMAIFILFQGFRSRVFIVRTKVASGLLSQLTQTQLMPEWNHSDCSIIATANFENMLCIGPDRNFPSKLPNCNWIESANPARQFLTANTIQRISTRIRCLWPPEPNDVCSPTFSKFPCCHSMNRVACFRVCGARSIGEARPCDRSTQIRVRLLHKIRYRQSVPQWVGVFEHILCVNKCGEFL